MAIDAAGIMSPFSTQVLRFNDADTPPAETDQLPFGLACAPIGLEEWNTPNAGFALLPARPNPFTYHTTLAVEIPASARYAQASIVVCDALGRERLVVPVPQRHGVQEITVNTDLPAGVYPYRLVVDGHTVAVRSMVVVD